MFNEGLLEIYRKIPTQGTMGESVEVLELYATSFYGELSFHTDEWYGARQSETEIVKRIRIPQDKTVCNKHVIIADGIQYSVGRTYSTDVKGIAVTDITLERITADYDIARIV